MRWTLLLLLLATFTSDVSTQPPIPEWPQIKQIKLLESHRTEINKLLPPEEFLSWGNDYRQFFSSKDTVVQVDFSDGTCSDSQEWNVPSGVITEVVVMPKDRFELKDVGIDYSRFRKERTDPQRKRILVRYDKPAGLAVSISYGLVEAIHLFPSKSAYGKLCDKPDVKEYYAHTRWVREPLSHDAIVDYNRPASVVDLSLNTKGAGMFAVSTKAEDPENDVLTYRYFVGSGNVVGTGANVVWDLSREKPGTYVIIAAVDDGMGYMGKYLKKTVTVP